MKRPSKGFLISLFPLSILLWLTLSFIFMWPPVYHWQPSSRPIIMLRNALSDVQNSKVKWMREHKARIGDIVNEQEVFATLYSVYGHYICPDRGKISINKVGTPASCSLHGVKKSKYRRSLILYDYRPRHLGHHLYNYEYQIQREKVLSSIYTSSHPLQTCAKLATRIINCINTADKYITQKKRLHS